MPADKPGSVSSNDLATIRRWIETVATSELGAARDAPPVTENEIVVLMWMHCTPCHGPHLQEAGLDLRTRTSMLKGGKSGSAMTPGDPNRSLIIQKVRAGAMPPPDRYQESGTPALPKASFEKLVAWIEQGAPLEETKSDAGLIDSDPLVSDQDREFWAFQPPKRATPPSVASSDLVRNPIDAFILRKLEEKGLRLSSKADWFTLIRRAYLDLTGLPPEPKEIERFLADRDPKAYENLINRLLQSPRYGERWGRYWLDVAGYQEHPYAWRYRDYVIRSWNTDKPYNRFLSEQIAGDELLDYENEPVITEEMIDNLVATGFLRMAFDDTGARATNFLPDRFQVVADEVQILSSAVLGLTLQCARCHDHKFDPLPQRDYYRLLAVFQGAYDPYDWIPPAFEDAPERKMLYFDTRVMPYVTPHTNPIKLAEERKQAEGHSKKLDREIEVLEAALKEKSEPLKKRLVEERLAEFPEDLYDDLLKMLATPPGEKNEFQKQLAKKFGKRLELVGNHLETVLRKMDPEYKRAGEETERRVALLKARKHPEPKIRALWDRGDPAPMYFCVEAIQ